MNDDILDSKQQATLVAKDILAATEIANHPNILYIPSKQLRNILSDEQIAKTIMYLSEHNGLSIDRRSMYSAGYIQVKAAYQIYTSGYSLRNVINPPSISGKTLAETGISLDKVRTILTINGTEIPLGRSEGEKTIQYWVCFHSMKKTNKPTEETDILNSYKKDYGIVARNRAVRDAVIALNKKIKAKVKLDKEPFIYSRGKVTYVEANKQPY